MLDSKKSPAIQLLENQLKARSIAAERFKINNRELIDAHNMAFSTLASMIDRHKGNKIESPSPEVEGQISLIAQFVIGIEHCENAIAEGLYSQAAALLKQELETLAAIEEYRDKRRKDGQTPRIGRGITRGYGPIYGRFNEISHVSHHDFAKGLVAGQVGELVGANILSTYNGDLARFLYGQHVSYIRLAVQLADRLFTDVYGSGINAEEKQWAGLAHMILIKSGLFELSAEEKGEAADWMRRMAQEAAGAA